jgi:ketosteroid isomerase-like protein
MTSRDEGTPHPQTVVERFNACINARDVDGLGDRMTDDHQFVDTAGATERGKAHCLDVWRGFFEQFPDYRNTFTSMQTRQDTVIVVGFSTCSIEVLSGAAIWSAKVRQNKIAEWRVYHDVPTHRVRLGLSSA